MLKIRRPLGRLIFNMGIAIPGKTVFLIETAPWFTAINILHHERCHSPELTRGQQIVCPLLNISYSDVKSGADHTTLKTVPSEECHIQHLKRYFYIKLPVKFILHMLQSNSGITQSLSSNLLKKKKKKKKEELHKRILCVQSMNYSQVPL